jgi:hypothetical protein
MAISVLSTDEYKAQTYEAVLVRENTIVCVTNEVNPEDDDFPNHDGMVRVIPLSNVNHVDADPDLLLSGTELPDWFYGGGNYGFVVVEEFPEIEDHLEDLQRETA